MEKENRTESFYISETMAKEECWRYDLQDIKGYQEISQDDLELGAFYELIHYDDDKYQEDDEDIRVFKFIVKRWNKLSEADKKKAKAISKKIDHLYEVKQGQDIASREGVTK